MSDQKDTRTPEQIERDLQAMREELTVTVNELVNRVDPRSSVKAVANGVKSATAKLRDSAASSFSAATDRAREAMGNASEAATSMMEQAREKAEQARDRAESVAEQARHLAEDARGVEDAGAQENTWAGARMPASAEFSDILTDAQDGDTAARGILVGAGAAVVGLAIWGISKLRS